LSALTIVRLAYKAVSAVVFGNSHSHNRVENTLANSPAINRAISHHPVAGADRDPVGVGGEGEEHLLQITGLGGPWSARSRSRPRIQAMPSGSRPFAGSSSTSTGGSPSSAAASANRCRIPSE